VRHVSIEYPLEYPALLGYEFSRAVLEKIMAMLIKQTKACGVRYKAVIKLNARIVKTKTFKTKTAANTWTKQAEGNLDYLDALGLPGASITIKELARTSSYRNVMLNSQIG
jgi:hypothetical protein